MAANGRPPKTAVLAAQRIIRDVVRRGLKPGDFLPPERTMLDIYEVGRGTLREALRLLEFQGVIAIKPGPGGGPALLDPDASHLASTIVLLMQFKQAPFRAIVEVRSALEPMISSLAAERMTDEALEELSLSIEQMRQDLTDQDLFFESNKRFHELVAWSSGNALFGYIADSLFGIMDGTAIGIDYPARRREAVLKAHEEIYAALLARDPKEAGSRMAEHIEAYVRYAQRKYPEVLEEVVQWDKLL